MLWYSTYELNHCRPGIATSIGIGIAILLKTSIGIAIAIVFWPIIAIAIAIVLSSIVNNPDIYNIYRYIVVS